MANSPELEMTNLKEHGNTMRLGRAEWWRSDSGQDGGWRLRLVAVAYFGAADRYIGSVSARAAAPGSLDCLPRFSDHQTCRAPALPPRPPLIDGLRLRAVGQRQCRPERGVVTTARPSAERLQSIPARPRMRWGCTTRDCEGAHRECCVCMWSSIDRPRGHDWVCV